MMSREIIRYEIVVPLKDNDGKDLSFEVQQLTDELVERFGGLTVVGGPNQPCSGYWKGLNHTYKDEVILLILDLPPQGQFPWEDCQRWRELLRQEVLYVTHHARSARLID